MFAACGEHEFSRSVRRAQAMMDAQPVEAKALLDSIRPAFTMQGTRWQQRYKLQYARARNKLEPKFTDVEATKNLVGYFEKNGSKEEVALAYYLVARTYADLGSGAMAIAYFQKSAELSDTSSVDCDYSQLCRTYAQIGQVYYDQNLLDECLAATNLSVKYALRAKDTLTSLMNQGQRLNVYYKRSQFHKVIQEGIPLAKRYERCGFNRFAATTCGMCANALLHEGRVEQAKEYMDFYERASGFFDENGQIEKGREVYYHTKGNYYLAIHRLDSAEYFFRKELADGKDFNNQNAAAEALARLFKERHQSDSVAKYAVYAYSMNDSVYKHTAITEVARMKEMYNYTLLQSKLQKERTRRYGLSLVLFIVCFLICILGLCLYLYINKVTREKKVKEEQYRQSLRLIKNTRMEIEALKRHENDFKQIIKEKEKIIAEQLNTIKKYSFNPDKRKQIEKSLKADGAYVKLEKLCLKGLSLSDEDFCDVREIIRNHLPVFEEFLQSVPGDVTEIEYKTIMLIRLYFKPKDISVLMNVSTSYITKIRNNLSLKIFGMSASSKDFDMKLMEID